MITTVLTNEKVTVANLQKVLYNAELIKQLARELVASHVEAHIDMAADCDPGEFATYSEAESYLKDAQTTVEDYMDDLLTDFRDMLYDAVHEVTVDVKSIKLSKGGLEDADVEVR